MTRSIFAVLLLACNAALAAPDSTAFRLGDAAVPASYDWHVAVDPREERFEGDVRIEVRVAAPVHAIDLDAIGLDVREATLMHDGARATLKWTAVGTQLLRLEPGGEIAPGVYVLEVRYTAPLEAVATRGLFRQRDGADWYVLSQFEAISARRALPCFDEPGWKTPWRLTIDAPSTERVVSNTREEHATPVEARAGWTRHEFAPTKPLPTYLVALAIGPFDIVDAGRAKGSATPIRNLAPRGRGAETRYANEVTGPIVDVLERYFGRPFPFAKLDQAPIPAAVGFGAMENAGLITYGSRYMLATPRQESLAFRRDFAATAAHEIAHQWFGDLVTMTWWNDVWLNEAFATWMSHKALLAWRPEFESGWRSGYLRLRALSADRLMSARRVANAVNDENDLYGAFDSITYSKGAQVISMFESWMGEERFRAGVRDYLAAHAYGNAGSDDFFQAIGAASGQQALAVEAFRSFIDQAGAPLVDVRLRCEGSRPSLELEQHRFIPRGTHGEDSRWITPACFRYSAGGTLHKQCTVIREAQPLPLETSTCPDWVVGNADGVGHWLARLDDGAFAKAVRHASELPEPEAVTFGIDTSLMVQSGLRRAREALPVAHALLHHSSAGVQRSAVELLVELRDGMLDPHGEAALAKIVRDDVRPLARRVGWTPRKGEHLDIQDLRSALLPYAADEGGDSLLRAKAVELGGRWLSDHGCVDASVVEPVLQTAARFGGRAFFDRLVAAIAKERNQPDRLAMIDALARVRDPALQERASQSALRPQAEPGALEPRDTLSFVVDVLEDKVNRATGFAFLMKHWDALISRLPPDTMDYVIRHLDGLCSAPERERFAEFVGPRAASIKGGPRAHAQTLEAIDICVAARVR